MTAEQALTLLRGEVTSNSPVGQALTLFLEAQELRHYRSTETTADAMVLAVLVGRGQGVSSIRKLLTQASAHPDRSV